MGEKAGKGDMVKGTHKQGASRKKTPVLVDTEQAEVAKT